MATGTAGGFDAMRGSALAIRPADSVMARSLLAGVAESITVPALAAYVMIKGTGNFFANYTTTATVPGDVTNGQASELNPDYRYVFGVTTISVIAPADCVVTASFYTA